MQSRKVIFVYLTIAPSALMPINIGLDGLGSEALTDATSNLGPSVACWAKAGLSEAIHIQTANDLIALILALLMAMRGLAEPSALGVPLILF
jgi:hypothetical protein